MLIFFAFDNDDMESSKRRVTFLSLIILLKCMSKSIVIKQNHTIICQCSSLYNVSKPPLLISDAQRGQKLNVIVCNENVRLFYLFIHLVLNIPLHVAPSPVNPCWHVQLYEPSVLMQSAFKSHGLASAEHSSISGERIKKQQLTRK